MMPSNRLPRVAITPPPAMRCATRIIAERARVSQNFPSLGLIRDNRRMWLWQNQLERIGKRRSGCLIFAASHELLHDAILQRVKIHHRQPAILVNKSYAEAKTVSRVRKLLIDENPYSLKGASCRVFALPREF